MSSLFENVFCGLFLSCTMGLVMSNIYRCYNGTHVWIYLALAQICTPLDVSHSVHSHNKSPAEYIGSRFYFSYNLCPMSDSTLV